jgi:hypothetical protein
VFMDAKRFQKGTFVAVTGRFGALLRAFPHIKAHTNYLF